MKTLSLRKLVPSVALLAFGAVPAISQAQARATPPAQAKSDSATILGTWTGIVTVALNDSTFQVPVSYTFTQSASGITGSALVPGQGQGTIGSVEREGTRVRFRVTVNTNDTNRDFHHDATLTGTVLEGTVHMDNQLVAKFKLSQARPNGTK